MTSGVGSPPISSDGQAVSRPAATAPDQHPPALFLDRDGVINEERNYLHDPRDLVVITGVPEAIAAVNGLGIPVVVVTNQAGIGRGMYDLAAYQSVTRAIDALLGERSARIDAWYFCPHLPDAGCTCRKPCPGMLVTAANELDLALTASVMVGDKISDLEAGQAAGARTVLVRTGYGRQVEAELAETGRSSLANYVADSLAAALPFVLETLTRSRTPGRDGECP